MSHPIVFLPCVVTKFSPWVRFPCRDIAFYVATVGHDVMSRPGRGRDDDIPYTRLDGLGLATERLELATTAPLAHATRPSTLG